MRAQLDQIRVASPCPVSWEQMTGDNRVRFCNECHLNVYNFAELTRTEAEDLLRTTEGSVCGRLYRRADGTLITKDCPVGLRAVRRRLKRVAGALFATLISMVSVVLGQKQPQQDKACRQQVKVTSKVEQLPVGSGQVTGTVLDPNGAVIAGAKVTFVNRATNKKESATSNNEGMFTRNLSPAVYELGIESPGFKRLLIRELRVAAAETKKVEATLLLANGTTVLIGVIADSSQLDFSTSEIKTVFDS
ncbi:MAG TPA: carboxypeptidase-like regulatory domain-containing protein, partial [Pyrinomonadaceae bacterium]|nr:carboxypeptidase-like regulatory domain-containing protein [Pyrinomonadaceae bacterium]